MSVNVVLDRFALLAPAAKEGLKVAVTEIGLAIEQRAKYKIVEQDAVDTGALKNSVYVQSAIVNGRDVAIAAAEEAAALPGKHTGKPHDAPVAVEVNHGGGLVAKVGVAMEYGAFIEMGTERMEQRPYLTPSAAEMQPKAGEIAAKRVREALEAA